MSNPTDIPTAMTLYGALVRDDNNPPQSIGWLKSYITLAAPTNTVVKAAAGFLHTITFNNPGASAVITVYDNTAASGTALIGTITMPASPVPTTLIYDVVFNTGLTIHTATAASDISVAYV